MCYVGVTLLIVDVSIASNARIKSPNSSKRTLKRQLKQDLPLSVRCTSVLLVAPGKIQLRTPSSLAGQIH